MPILAGWLTGEQVPQETIEQTIMAMSEVLGRHGGEAARIVQSGSGLVAFSDTAYAMQQNDDPAALDWIPDRRTLVYRRPLSGQHALYYIEDWPAQGNLLFASEIKALFAVGVPRRLHLAALDALWRYGFIPAPWTAFKDIQIVPAGSILRWQHAKTVVNHATDYQFTAASPETYTQEQLSTLLDQTSAGLLPPHENLVALTSGSPSSALSTLQMARHTTAPFSVAALSSTRSTRSKQWHTVQQIADACERPLLAITGVDQPEFWTATLAGLEAPCVDSRPLALHQLLHTLASETGARVAVSGLGARVLLDQVQPSQTPEMAGEDILDRYRHTLMRQHAQSIWSPAVAKQLQEEKPWEKTLHALKLARQAEKLSAPQQAWHYLDLHLRLPDLLVQPIQQLATQERMAVRSPYLSTSTMKILAHLPAVLDDGTTKDTLLPALVQRSLPDTYEPSGALPLAIPTASLLHITDSDLLQQVLSADALKTTGLFDPQAVANLIKQAGEKTLSPELLLVFTTQLLYQLFEVEGW